MQDMLSVVVTLNRCMYAQLEQQEVLALRIKPNLTKSCTCMQDMLSVVVTLNRCMYAQLEQQDFEAPSGFSMPPIKSPQHSAAQRGMKLACGFEMLYARSSKKEVCLISYKSILIKYKAYSRVYLMHCPHFLTPAEMVV